VPNITLESDPIQPNQLLSGMDEELSSTRQFKCEFCVPLVDVLEYIEHMKQLHPGCGGAVVTLLYLILHFHTSITFIYNLFMVKICWRSFSFFFYFSF